MSLSPGQRLGPYEITAPLGAGGMGEVYRARDTRLGREVAIKALPAEVARDPERLARFRREAQLLAALNHPNVAAIHGLEEADGQPFLVLELVPGEDLAERLKRGALPADEALSIAEQIAGALEEAHEHGIVHRDLKPANVKVTPEGKVKVLDFGLAKAWAGEAASGSSADLSQSPTLAHTGTAAGLILGTAAYMSPEQARGKTVDKRADIWAFGAVLHEMLTGKPLFTGETVSDVLAAVLTREPDWAALPESTPPSVRRLLRRCLERDPKRRLRDIGEARIALSAPNDKAATGGGGRRTTGDARWRRFILPAAIAVAGLAFAAGYAAPPAGRAPTPLVGADTVVRQLTFDPGLEAEPSFSPDGNYVAYTTNDRGSLDIVVMPVAGGQVRRLVETEADEAQAAWSPDGTQVAFTSARDHDGRLKNIGGLSALSTFVQGQGGDLFLVPAAGGTAAKLVERGAYPAWSPDGKTIAFQSDRGGHWNIWVVPSQGGEPRRLTDDADIDFQPAWSPDGKWIAYASTGLKVVPSDQSGPPRTLTVPAQGVLTPAWSSDGRWLYFAANRSRDESRTSLWRLAFPPEERPSRVERITLGESADVDPAVAASGGRLAYGRVSYAPDLWELDPRSGVLRQITSTSCLEDYPHLSPDGRTLVSTPTARAGPGSSPSVSTGARCSRSRRRRSWPRCPAGRRTARRWPSSTRPRRRCRSPFSRWAASRSGISSPSPSPGRSRGRSGLRTAAGSRTRGEHRTGGRRSTSWTLRARTGRSLRPVASPGSPRGRRTAGCWPSSGRRTGPGRSGWCRREGRGTGGQHRRRGAVAPAVVPEGHGPDPRRGGPQEPGGAVGREGHARAPHPLRRVDALRRLSELVRRWHEGPLQHDAQGGGHLPRRESMTVGDLRWPSPVGSAVGGVAPALDGP